jgi:Lrp/AsnC family transcriptional regulator, leucine-responsive regulatory protein
MTSTTTAIATTRNTRKTTRRHLSVSPRTDNSTSAAILGGGVGASDPGCRTEDVIDGVDRRLIELLQANGRASYAELARQVGLSAPAVHERVGKLESAGVITGYRAVVDPTAVGLDVTALISVIESDSVDETGVEAALAAMPEVEDCWRVAGSEGYVLKVRVADIPALEAAISALNRIRGVARTRTTVVLSTKWEGRHG